MSDTKNNSVNCYPLLNGVCMFGWLKSDPKKNLQKQIQKKLAQATEYQRNGKLREYAELIEEVEALEKKLSDT